MTKLFTILGASILFFGAHASNAIEISEWDQRLLFARCAPVAYFVSLGDDDANRVGLTKADLENTVKSRLQAARLFAVDAEQVLLVGVSSIDVAYIVDVWLVRELSDAGFGRPGAVAVWMRKALGRRGSDALGPVSQYLDEFIAKYLRVNEEHCAKR